MPHLGLGANVGSAIASFDKSQAKLRFALLPNYLCLVLDLLPDLSAFMS
jgi:hypothetical protein